MGSFSGLQSKRNNLLWCAKIDMESHCVEEDELDSMFSYPKDASIIHNNEEFMVTMHAALRKGNVCMKAMCAPVVTPFIDGVL